MLRRMIDSRSKGNGGPRGSAARAASHSGMIRTPVALLMPGIAPHVVSVLLPEARVVLLQQLKPADPLRALPEIEMGHQQTHRPAVLGREWLTVVAEREQVRRAVEIGQGKVGGEAMLRV